MRKTLDQHCEDAQDTLEEKEISPEELVQLRVRGSDFKRRIKVISEIDSELKVQITDRLGSVKGKGVYFSASEEGETYVAKEDYDYTEGQKNIRETYDAFPLQTVSHEMKDESIRFAIRRGGPISIAYRLDQDAIVVNYKQQSQRTEVLATS
jgi:hypothetical protein